MLWIEAKVIFAFEDKIIREVTRSLLLVQIVGLRLPFNRVGGLGESILKVTDGHTQQRTQLVTRLRKLGTNYLLLGTCLVPPTLPYLDASAGAPVVGGALFYSINTPIDPS